MVFRSLFLVRSFAFGALLYCPGVEKQDGTLWHAYGRKWATERKHLPDVDVAAAGGWSDTTTLKLVYQQADMAGMQAVVDGPVRIRQLR